MLTSAQSRFQNDRSKAAQLALASQLPQSPVPASAGRSVRVRKPKLPGFNVASNDPNVPNPNSFRERDLEQIIGTLAEQQNSLSVPSILANDLAKYKTGPEEPAEWNMDGLIKDISLDRFFNSPMLSEAVSRAKLTEYFQSQNMRG